MKWRILAAVILVVSITIGVSSPVFAAYTKYEFMDTNGDGDSNQIYGGEYVAEIFKSDATLVHTVTQIAVELKIVGTPGNVNVGLKAVSGGVPTGADLTSGTLNGNAMSTSYAFYKFNVTAYSLTPNTDYAIVVSLDGGVAATDYVLWHKDTGGDGDANDFGLHSHDSGVNWTSDTPTDYLFQIYGNTAYDVVDAVVVKSYLTSGDWLIVAEVINLYPGYYNQAGQAVYFQVQLVSGSTVLASTTLKSWGDAPVAIYLSPNTVTPLSWGSSYVVRVRGNFTGNPTDSYTLSNTITNSDWLGTNLELLDEWLINTAKRMYVYDGSPTGKDYTTKRSDGGEVITTYGSGPFVAGIPSIMDVRPDIFSTPLRNPNYDLGTATNAFDNEVTWQVQTGSTIASDAQAFGAVLGVTAKQFMSMGIWLVYIMSMIFVFASSRGQGAETIFVAVINLPILFIGLNLRLIDAYVVAVMCAMAVLIFLTKMWFSK